MVGIVLLIYNQWDITIDCIKTIRDSCELPYKIYLVDNNSTEKETKKFLDFYYQSDDIVLIRQNQNRGYSAGNNVGIKAALDDKCDFVLISNNDVLFKKSCIDNMCDFLSGNHEYGIVGPKVLTKNGDLQELNMCCKMTLKGKYQYIFRKTPLRFLSKKFVDKFNRSESRVNGSFDVFAVSGCCFMMSKEAVHMLYPFDENTFLYEEENIIGIRMERLGLKTLYNVNCEVIHIGGKSTNGLTSFGYACFVESEIYYCRKYLKASRFKIIPLYLFRSFAYIGYYRLQGIYDYFLRTFRMLIKKISI